MRIYEEKWRDWEEIFKDVADSLQLKKKPKTLKTKKKKKKKDALASAIDQEVKNLNG